MQMARDRWAGSARWKRSARTLRRAWYTCHIGLVLLTDETAVAGGTRLATGVVVAAGWRRAAGGGVAAGWMRCEGEGGRQAVARRVKRMDGDGGPGRAVGNMGKDQEMGSDYGLRCAANSGVNTLQASLGKAARHEVFFWCKKGVFM